MGAACLLIHGYCGSPFEMEPLAGPLRDAGFAVGNIRLPGHGTTVDDFLTTDFTDWRAATDAAYHELAARHKTVLAVGLSMGGTLALSLAARFPLAGVLSLAAPIYIYRFFPWQVQDLRLLALPLLAKLCTVLPAKPGRPESRTIAPWQGYEGVSCPRQLLSLSRGVAETRRLLPQVTAPLRIIHDRRDRLVYADNAWEIARNVSSRQVSLRLLGIEENVTSKHLLTTHKDVQDDIARDVLAFARAVAVGELESDPLRKG